MGIFQEDIVYNDNKLDNNNCYIKAVGNVKSDPNYIISRNNSETVVIAYVCSGKAYLEINNSCFPLQKGDCYILPRQIKSKIYSNKKEPLSMLWVNTKGQIINCLIDSYFNNQEAIITNLNIEKFFIDINTLLKSDKKDINDKSSIAIHKLFINIKNSLSKNSNRNKFSNDIEKKIETYIVNHLQEKFSINELARSFNLSTSQTIKLFKRKFECTPYNYYLKIKIDIAKSMLIDTDLTIDDIACRLNFLDRNHFSKYFAKKVGLTPVKYRKANIQKI